MPEKKNIVMNTGPLLALIAGMEDLSFLQPLYNRILIPFEVCQEIEKGGSTGFGISEFHKARFLDKKTDPVAITSYLNNTLDLGEAAVIQIAMNEKINTVCIDEAFGRRIARLNGLSVTGSIGILIRAKKSGCNLSIRNTLYRMQKHGIFISQKVIQFAIKQAHE